MFIDARALPMNAVVETDLCIIGGGAAGITISHQFIGTPVQVCLLESGTLDFDRATQTLYEGRNVGLPYFDLDVCQIRYFGGNTNAWGGWCRPLDPIDFRRRPWVPESGWPIGAAEIGDPRARLVPFDPTQLEASIYRFSAPTRFGQVYREALRQAGNIRCYLNANVLRIMTSPEARSVTHVLVGCLG